MEKTEEVVETPVEEVTEGPVVEKTIPAPEEAATESVEGTPEEPTPEAAPEEKVLEDFEEEATEEEVVPETAVTEEPVKEIAPKPEPITLDDLDDVPSSEKFRKVKADEKIEAKELTIAKVGLGRALTQDKDGKLIPPEENENKNKYYKAKLILEFEEEINGDRIREFVPSIFYSVDVDGAVALVPTIPKACTDDKLEDNFTSSLSKIRNKYCKFMKIEDKNLGSSTFLKGLEGKKVKVETESGVYKGKPWQKIKIIDFV